MLIHRWVHPGNFRSYKVTSYKILIFFFVSFVKKYSFQDILLAGYFQKCSPLKTANANIRNSA